MSRFHTSVPLTESSFKLQCQDTFITLGSCFADEIGQFFVQHKFRMLVNPLGIVFNPASLAKLLNLTIHGDSIAGYDEILVGHDGLWHSLLNHGRFSQPDKTNLIRNIDKAFQSTRLHLQESDYLIITLGSAHAYRHLRSGEIVTNCHKLPATDFKKELLTIPDIENILQKALEDIKSINNKIRIFLTVSPIRYLRDGIIESNRSKAHLLASVHSLIDRLDYCYYFPAYELVIDDLRDYRFFREDMTHPTAQTINYVLDRFILNYADDEVRKQITDIGRFKRSLEHRPFHPQSKTHQEFLKSRYDELNALKVQYPEIDFSLEEDEILKDIP